MTSDLVSILEQIDLYRWFLRSSTVTCSQGPRVMLTLKFSVSQMTLDALGDILSNGEWILL